MAEGVLVVDERGRILVANHALRQLLHLPHERGESNRLGDYPKCTIRGSDSKRQSRKRVAPHLN